MNPASNGGTRPFDLDFARNQAAGMQARTYQAACDEIERLRAALNCSHNNVPPDDPDNPWTYIEHEGKTWNFCPECRLAELWEGGMFFEAKVLA